MKWFVMVCVGFTVGVKWFVTVCVDFTVGVKFVMVCWFHSGCEVCDGLC